MKRIIQTLILVFAVHAVFGQCQAYFTSTNDSTGANIYLYDQSYNTDSTPITITDYTWTVQYGGATYTYTSANPIVPLNGFSGPVWVCLSIISSTACMSSYCDTIFINNPIQGCYASWSYSINGFLGTYDFLDYSTSGNPSATVNSWYWEITDNLSNILFTSTQQYPSFAFPGNGTYGVCLTIATDSGCIDTDCGYVTVYDSTPNNCQLYVYPQITNVSVIGGTDGAIDLTVSGGTPPYAYFWSTGAVTQDISGLPSGVYTVNITQADTTCSAYSATFQIIEPYDTIPLDTLFVPPIDTCLNFVPDSFYVSIISVDPSQITITWVFMGGGMSQTITVTYTYSNYGPYVIAITIDCGTKNLTTFMTYINITSSLGISEMRPEDIRVYPNPVTNTFNLEMPAGSANATIQVFNSMGQLMVTDATGNNSKTIIDASQWPAGIYMVRLSDGQGQYITRNIVKQ
jgi:hypothetical protein